MTTMTPPIIKRILLPLSAQRPPAGLLEQAATIAARLQSELCGLFIEDSDLLNFAQLPVGREIGFSTGRVQHSSMSSMERSLRQVASRSQQELSRLATHYKIQSQFVTRRGHTWQTMQMEIQPGDLLILSGQGQQAQQRLSQQAHAFLQSGHHYLAWLPPASLTADDITVLEDQSPAAAEARQLARQLTQANGHAIRREPYTNNENLRAKLQACKKGLWILPYRPDWDVTVLEQLLSKSTCPVLIINHLPTA
ncbi:MAG: hypothetical protein R6X06_00090 [Gammaproteobacteria bacterium]